MCAAFSSKIPISRPYSHRFQAELQRQAPRRSMPPDLCADRLVKDLLHRPTLQPQQAAPVGELPKTAHVHSHLEGCMQAILEQQRLQDYLQDYHSIDHVLYWQSHVIQCDHVLSMTLCADRQDGEQIEFQSPSRQHPSLCGTWPGGRTGPGCG